jgi:hypothetical protein
MKATVETHNDKILNINTIIGVLAPSMTKVTAINPNRKSIIGLIFILRFQTMSDSSYPVLNINIMVATGIRLKAK